MIEGNVEIVEDPSGGNTDVHMIMENLYVAGLPETRRSNFI